jgi:hypothetical protein
MKMIFENQNSSFANMKSYLDYPFERCSSWDPFSLLRVILVPSLTGPERRLFLKSGIIGLKIKTNSSIPI